MAAERAHGRFRRAGKADGHEAEIALGFKCAQNVQRASRGRDAKKHIARPPEPARLPFEHMLEAVIVSHCGQDGRVGGHRQRRQGPAVDQITREKFGGEMLRIGGAAAIAGDEELAAGAHARFDRVRDFTDQPQQRGVLGRGLQGCERPVEKAGDKSVVVRLSSHGPSLCRQGRQLTG